ncbi:hypothetical protein Efla_000677 [Eimeria flavescens]
MAYNAQQAGQPGPAYGQAYASGGAPPPAAAYGSGGSAPYGRAATGGYQGYPNTGGQPYGAPAAPYGAPPSAYGAPPSAYGAPYGGPPPPYPPTAPVCPPGSPGGAYPYAAQAQPMYGKPVNSTPSHLEMGGGASPPVSDEEKITDQISVEIRHAFVRKVLGILAIQILITFGVASAFGFIPAIRNFLLANYWLAIVAVVSAFVVQMVLVCVPDLARKVPTNFILMTLITLCYAVVLSCAAAASSRDAFLIAIGSTFVVVVGLMLFACQTKYDFTGAGTYLFVAMLCLMIFDGCGGKAPTLPVLDRRLHLRCFDPLHGYHHYIYEHPRNCRQQLSSSSNNSSSSKDCVCACMILGTLRKTGGQEQQRQRPIEVTQLPFLLPQQQKQQQQQLLVLQAELRPGT